MNAAAADRIRQMVEFRAEQLATIIDEMDRAAEREFTVPPRKLRDFPPHTQVDIYEMAARELAAEWREM